MTPSINIQNDVGRRRHRHKSVINRHFKIWWRQAVTSFWRHLASSNGHFYPSRHWCLPLLFIGRIIRKYLCVALVLGLFLEQKHFIPGPAQYSPSWAWKTLTVPTSKWSGLKKISAKVVELSAVTALTTWRSGCRSTIRRKKPSKFGPEKLRRLALEWLQVQFRLKNRNRSKPRTRILLRDHYVWSSHTYARPAARRVRSFVYVIHIL